MNVYIQNFTIYVHVLFWSKSYKKNNTPSFNPNEQMYRTLNLITDKIIVTELRF